MPLPRLKPKTGQVGLYLLLLGIILCLMALMRWLPGHAPQQAQQPVERPFTIAMVYCPEAVRTDSAELHGPGIELASRLESVLNEKIRIIPVPDRQGAVQALLAGAADLIGPIAAAQADSSLAFSEIAIWKRFSTGDASVAFHPATLRTGSDSVTLPLKWAVRRSDSSLLRTVNDLLD